MFKLTALRNSTLNLLVENYQEFEKYIYFSVEKYDISPISRYRKHIFLPCMVLGQFCVMNSENQISPQQLSPFFCPETNTAL